jgi:hypothetical protein
MRRNLRKRSEAWEEVWQRRGDAAEACDRGVAELVDENQHDEDHGELPAPEQRVEPNRGEEAERTQEYLPADQEPFEVQQDEQQRFELREQDAEADGARSEAFPPPVRTRSLGWDILAFGGALGVGLDLVHGNGFRGRDGRLPKRLGG